MKTVVVINFFPAFTPPSSGGEMRVGSLYRALSRNFNVQMLTSTDFGARSEEIQTHENFTEFRFPKDEHWRHAYAALEQSGLAGDLAGLAFALAVSEPECRLRRRARELAASAAYVIHEFPFSEPIFNDFSCEAEIYNSHNFEAGLLASIVSGTGFEAAQLKLINLERNLVARCRKIFATSNADLEKFRLFYGTDPAKLAVCPNGFDPAELAGVGRLKAISNQLNAAKPKLLFTGSGHYPNVDAVDYLMKIAPQLPQCEFIVAGGVCSSFKDKNVPENITFFGPFSPDQKVQLLSEATIILNPVTLGSGTSLKAIEALGAGIPMLSTPEGVRGLGVISGEHCEIASREGFVAAVHNMLCNEARSQRIARSGQIYSHANFAWQGIAERLATDLETIEPITLRPQNMILALNDYSVMQPGSGGIARIRNLLRNLDQDVVLVSFGEQFDVGLISEGFLHVVVPKTAAHRSYEDCINAGQPMSVNDAVASIFAPFNRCLVTLVSEFARRAAVAVFEHPYMATLLDIIDQAQSDIPIVYSSHNVEENHKESILIGHSAMSALSSYITELERRVVKRADLVVCCTVADESHFRKYNTETILVPNGCDLIEQGELTPCPSSLKRVGFLGSGHGPNVEAARFIIDEVSPYFPDVAFDFVGSVCGSLDGALGTNVTLHGQVPERIKSQLLATWDLALNPIESGGGSSLKLPDYMAHGLPTLNTEAGARGFDVSSRGAGIVTEREQFRSALAEMLNDHALLQEQGARARRYAEDELAWPSITHQYRTRLKLIGVVQPLTRKFPKVLVVTYRYTEPSLGGAEEYLVEILKRLRPMCGRIDLASTNVEHLTNHHHFGCRWNSPQGGASGRIGDLFDRSIYFKVDQVSEEEILSSCRVLERAWAGEEFDLFLPFASEMTESNRVRVFSGFYWPENHGGQIKRWTSPKFSFLVPAAARTFRLEGFASRQKEITFEYVELRANQVTVLCKYEMTINAHFAFDLSLPVTCDAFPAFLRCSVEEHYALDDHRPFGVLVERASVMLDATNSLAARGDEIAPLKQSIADLSEIHEDRLRSEFFERWITSLRRIALGRDPAIDTLFARVRGPHSEAMQAWIAQNAHAYDCVLVQGIPFDVIPRTVETISSLPNKPRLITLPHFHGDDRFYHWRRYYEAFAAADSNLIFSKSIGEALQLPERVAVVAGGGVRLEEATDPTALADFVKISPTLKPFFLVLGRKTASKGYREAIAAHQELRRSGIDVDLVMIGPDEDGQRVEGEGVHYMGRQSRSVIRGALAACLALVSMSQSESFGIVLCEAWLFGKPVIANRNCYSFRDLMDDVSPELLTLAGPDLTATMARLVGDARLRRQVGASGVLAVTENFSWESAARRIYLDAITDCGTS